MKWGVWTLENLRFPRHFKKRVLYGEPNIVQLTFKRLALLKNWLIYSLQSVLSHFMTTVLHFMSRELNAKIENAKNLTEIINVHSTYINKISDLCFQTKKNENICQGIMQVCLVSNVQSRVESLFFLLFSCCVWYRLWKMSGVTWKVPKMNWMVRLLSMKYALWKRRTSIAMHI